MMKGKKNLHPECSTSKIDVRDKDFYKQAKTERA